jgi:hypothetical protein
MQKMTLIGVNHLALVNSAGTRVVAFNKLRNQLKSKYTEIVNYLSAYPKEQFQLIGKKDIRTKNIMEEFITYESLQGLPVPEPAPHVQDFSNAIEVERLKLQIQAMEREKADNEQYIEELSAKLEEVEGAEQLGDNGAPPWIETLVKVVGALAEKYIDQRGQMIEIEKQKLQQHPANHEQS